ncbi:hypothetical protein N7486_003100 [Penicillium sp. IBT 16267x]|nr:hypothetical protein N7486_003100 [Penicillium sp. IBT 16267x]
MDIVYRKTKYAVFSTYNEAIFLQQYTDIQGGRAERIEKLIRGLGGAGGTVLSKDGSTQQETSRRMP